MLLLDQLANSRAVSWVHVYEAGISVRRSAIQEVSMNTFVMTSGKTEMYCGAHALVYSYF